MSARRGEYVPTAPCVHCGMGKNHVDHDDAETRATGSLSGPQESYGGLDYYTWAGIESHDYEPMPDWVPPVDKYAPRPSSDDESYRRGYQAGYHAAMRRRP